MHEKEENIRELERKIEEKDRELHAIRLDNEAVSLTIIYVFFLLLKWIVSIHIYCLAGLG